MASPPAAAHVRLLCGASVHPARAMGKVDPVSISQRLKWAIRVGKLRAGPRMTGKRRRAVDKARRRASRFAHQQCRYSPRRLREDAMSKSMSCIFAVALSAAAPSPSRAEAPKLPVPAIDQSAIAQRGYFYVGGRYVGEPGKEIMQGQVYVEALAPREVRRPYPLVLIHGAAQTATNWMGTPDGRKGWAEFFVEQGYVVYMMEQPMRGRSAWHPSDGATRMFRVDEEERLFTDNARSGNWPQAKKQTQWPGEGPGKGKKGDPVFDAFYATQVEALASLEETEKANQARS